MAWWIIVYLGLFGVLSVVGMWDDYCDRRPMWFLACAAASNLILIYLFMAFWQPSLRAPLGLLAPLAFLAAVGWDFFQAIEDFRNLRPDPELSGKQKRVIEICTFIALLVTCLPVFVVAGMSAFKVQMKD